MFKYSRNGFFLIIRAFYELGPRTAIKRSIFADFLMQGYIYAGYDLEPQLYEDDVEVSFSIRVGYNMIELKNIKPGKNPIWNELI
jgi:hypothetical protein